MTFTLKSNVCTQSLRISVEIISFMDVLFYFVILSKSNVTTLILVSKLIPKGKRSLFSKSNPLLSVTYEIIG